MADTIELRDVRAYGRHGADAGERERVQPLDLTLRLDLNLRSRAAQRRLGGHARLRRRCTRGVVATSSRRVRTRLLERLGDALLADIMSDAARHAAEITLAKPGLLAGATPAVTVRARVADGERASASVRISATQRPTCARRSTRSRGFGSVTARSRLYRSPPWGATDQPDFVNAAVLLETALEPRSLLAALKALETRIGTNRRRNAGVRASSTSTSWRTMTCRSASPNSGAARTALAAGFRAGATGRDRSRVPASMRSVSARGSSRASFGCREPYSRKDPATWREAEPSWNGKRRSSGFARPPSRARPRICRVCASMMGTFAIELRRTPARRARQRSAPLRHDAASSNGKAHNGSRRSQRAGPYRAQGGVRRHLRFSRPDRRARHAA